MRIENRLLALLLVFLAGCASSAAKVDWRSVEARNVYRDGSEAVPSELEGCEFLGRVSASAPEMSRSSAVFNDPSVLLETLQKMAANKGGNVLLYSLPPRPLQYGGRTLAGKAFKCPA
jgi:hypothetical protein